MEIFCFSFHFDFQYPALRAFIGHDCWTIESQYVGELQLKNRIHKVNEALVY